MRIIFMGTPDFAVETLKAILAAGHEVAAVYAQPPRKAGRGQKERPTPVHAFADSEGIEVRTPLNFKDPADVAAFTALDADVAVVVAYGLLLPQTLLDAARRGCVNVHASLLPRWRGAAPIHRAVEAGDEETGVCIMQMEAGLDTGPVIARACTAIGAEETTGELHDRLALLGAQTLVDVLSQPTWTAEPQPEQGVTYAKKIDKTECAIDWSQSASAIARRINAFSPFPGAYATLSGERIKFLKARVADDAGDCGRVLSGFTIACGEGAIEVLTAQRAGKGAMDQEIFLRGFPIQAGAVFQ